MTPIILSSIATGAAFTALISLYFALLSVPLAALFGKSDPAFSLKSAMTSRIRTLLGVAALVLGTLHGILMAMTVTSSAGIVGLTLITLAFSPLFAKMIRAWGPFLYGVGLFTLVHVFMSGSHFQDMTAPLPLALFGALFVLLFLECIRFNHFVTGSFRPQFAFYSSFVGLIMFSWTILGN